MPSPRQPAETCFTADASPPGQPTAAGLLRFYGEAPNLREYLEQQPGEVCTDGLVVQGLPSGSAIPFWQ